MNESSEITNPRGYEGRYGLKAWQVLINFSPMNPASAMIWGQIILYLLRWEKKDGVKDLKKAHTWLTELIALAEGVPCDSLFRRATEANDGLPETDKVQEGLSTAPPSQELYRPVPEKFVRLRGTGHTLPSARLDGGTALGRTPGSPKDTDNGSV